MIDFKQLTFSDTKFFKKKGKKNKPTSDTIYTYDIEVSSIYKLDGVWQAFDYSRPQEDYSGIEKIGVPYIWMFGVDDTCYYGRHFLDIEIVLHKISDPILQKVVWVHSLAYEFQFLRQIFDKYTIENMVCRDALKPIAFTIKELNIQFRCSYMLTNMNLDKASKEYGTEYKKTGTFDYIKVRGENTPLNEETELPYCEYDILSLASVIKYFLKKYKHIANIPLTSTGEVRRALRDRLDYWYFLNKSWSLVPDPDMYLKLMTTFAGGYTHANMLYVNMLMYLVKSKDIASSYPYVLCTQRFPVKPFKAYDFDRYMQLSKYDSYAWFFEVKLTGVKSRYYNHYISYSKAYDVKNVVTDNGRIASADELTTWCTDVDLKIIMENYEIQDIEYIHIYGSFKDYLDKRIIRYILDLYQKKTSLKGVAGMEDVYKQSKAYINSVYGMAVTNALKNSARYDLHKDKQTGEMVLGWHKLDPTDDEEFDKFVKETLEGQKKSYSNLIYYATGLWCTSYARANVYLTLLKIDKDEIYCDTDSIKYIGEHDDIFEEYNQGVLESYKAVIKHYPEFTLDDFMPVDSKGVKRPIGFFEDDGEYEEFKTLGAKKYCYRENGKLHITVAGVSKKGVTALKDDINNFHKGFTFGYKESGKLTHFYRSDQIPCEFTDYLGNTNACYTKYGVILQPTTYTIGITPEFETLVNMLQEVEFRNVQMD